MFTYQQLDFVADSYIPMLLLIAIIHSFFKPKFSVNIGLKGCGSLLIMFIASVYGIMFVDHYFQIWGSVGLDYSTHTALAVALVLYLKFVDFTYVNILYISFVAYLILMRYQEYHSVMDMFSTLFVIIPLLLFLKKQNDKLPFCRA